MKKWIFSLAIMFSISTTHGDRQKMMEHHHEKAPQKFLSHEPGYLSPDLVETEYLSVKGMEIKGFNAEGLKKLKEAFALLERAANSEEFKDRVINFKNTKGEREFASNKGLTNEEVYERFMEGREILQQNTPGEMNFFLRLYYAPWSKVIGYTSSEMNTIHINWRFFKDYQPYDVAANLAHEWTHKIGFDHKSAAEHDSAPYAIGYILGDIAEKISNSKSNKPH